MKSYKIWIIVLLIIFLFILAILFLFVIKEEKFPWCGDGVCEETENHETCPEDCKSTKIEQGIKGTITLYQGNCMPPVGSGCIINNVSTTIKIYPLILKEDVLNKYYEGEQEPVATVTSNSNGFYEIGLPSGKYSVFVEDPINENKEYCNNFDNNYSCPVVINGDIVELNIKIDHATW